MLELRQNLGDHVKDCTENGIAMRSEMAEMRTTQQSYHKQNTARLDGIVTSQTSMKTINQEQLDILNAIATGKRATVGLGKLVIWLGSVITAVLATIAGWTWLRTH